MARRPLAMTFFVLVVLCVALVARCTNGGVRTGPLLRDRATGIAGLTIEVGGEDLLIDFVGGPEGDVLRDPCSAQYELEVNDQTTPIEITVWELKPMVRLGFHGCTQIGYQRQLRHAISGARPGEVIDGSNDAIVPVIMLGDLLSPSVLPDAWTIRGSGMSLGPTSRTTVFTDGTSFVSLQMTLVLDPEIALDRFRSGSPQPQPVELQGDPLDPIVIPLSPLPFNGTVQEITIRNSTAALTEMTDEGQRLRFVHGSYLYEFSAGLDVPTAVITAIAEGLE